MKRISSILSLAGFRVSTLAAVIASHAAFCAEAEEPQIGAIPNIPELKAKAEGGSIEAEGKLGLAYGNGWSVARDFNEAIKWYRKAAEQGDPDAQNNLGLMYKNGWGVPKKCEEAIRWFRMAAEKGNAKAQDNLGVMYSGGFVEKDIPEAIKWYRLAAENGDIQAECSLGQLYDYGYSLPKNHAEAMSWYRKAAEQGDATAQFALGTLYFRGEAVAHDSIDGYKWLALSIRQGVDGLSRKQDSMTQLLPAETQAGVEAATRNVLKANRNFRDLLVKAMSPAEIADGERRADSFARKEPIPASIERAIPATSEMPPVATQSVTPGSLQYLDAHNGFRDLQFGTELSSMTNMVFDHDLGGCKAYRRIGEDLHLGQVPIQSITYVECSGQFGMVIITADEDRMAGLLSATEQAYGDPGALKGSAYKWIGKKAMATFSYNGSGKPVSLDIRSIEIMYKEGLRQSGKPPSPPKSGL